MNKEGAAFEGVAQGHVSLTVESPMEEGDTEPRVSNIRLPLRAKVNLKKNKNSLIYSLILKFDFVSLASFFPRK